MRTLFGVLGFVSSIVALWKCWPYRQPWYTYRDAKNPGRELMLLIALFFLMIMGVSSQHPLGFLGVAIWIIWAVILVAVKEYRQWKADRPHST